jgi:hypothetical protein
MVGAPFGGREVGGGCRLLGLVCRLDGIELRLQVPRRSAHSWRLHGSESEKLLRRMIARQMREEEE